MVRSLVLEINFFHCWDLGDTRRPSFPFFAGEKTFLGRLGENTTTTNFGHLLVSLKSAQIGF